MASLLLARQAAHQPGQPPSGVAGRDARCLRRRATSVDRVPRRTRSVRITDLRTLVREASASGLLTVVDNTFASPCRNGRCYLVRPAERSSGLRRRGRRGADTPPYDQISSNAYWSKGTSQHSAILSSAIR